MTKSIECKCTYRFTCRYCLQNAKPYYFTVTDKPGPVSYEPKEGDQ
jgi:hypothetical protein